MGRKKIRDLLTECDKEKYWTLTRDLMFCTSDNERDLVNKKIADLLTGVIKRQIPRNDEHAASLDHTSQSL